MQTVPTVHMVKSNCMEDSSEMKEIYKFVTMECGFSCVMMSGCGCGGGRGSGGQTLYVDSWDMPIVTVS